MTLGGEHARRLSASDLRHTTGSSSRHASPRWPRAQAARSPSPKPTARRRCRDDPLEAADAGVASPGIFGRTHAVSAVSRVPQVNQTKANRRLASSTVDERPVASSMSSASVGRADALTHALHTAHTLS